MENTVNAPSQNPHITYPYISLLMAKSYGHPMEIPWQFWGSQVTRNWTLGKSWPKLQQANQVTGYGGMYLIYRYTMIWYYMICIYIYTHCLLFSSILLASLLFSCLCDRILLYSLVFASILLHSLLFYSFPCNIVSYHARTTNIWVTSRYCNQYIYIFWAFTLAICGHQETVNIGSS